MNQKDKNYYDSVLNSMALRIYSLKDIIKDEEKAEELIREHETYIAKKAGEIFTQYREADTAGRLLLGIEGLMLARDVAADEKYELKDLEF